MKLRTLASAAMSIFLVTSVALCTLMGEEKFADAEAPATASADDRDAYTEDHQPDPAWDAYRNRNN